MSAAASAIKTLFDSLLPDEKVDLLKELNKAFEAKESTKLDFRPKISRKQQVMELALLMNRETRAKLARG